MNIYTIIVLIYFVVVIMISLFTKKLASGSSADFLVAGRNLGLITCAVVVASEWLGGMSTIGVSEKAFTSGTLQPILYNLSTATGMVIIGFTVARHYREKHVHTVSEMIEHLFDKRSRNISAIAFLVAYIVLAFVQLQTCAGVIAPLFQIDWWVAVLISATIITIYSYIGGLHAIAITSVVHVIVMFLGIILATVIGLNKLGGFGELQNILVNLPGESASPENLFNPFSAGFMEAFSLLLGGVLGGMAGQASIQPIFAARSPKTAKNAAILSALIIAPFGIMIAILGLMAKTGRFIDTSAIADAKTVLPTLLMEPKFIPPILGGLALAGILAAILSTVGPVNFAVVTIAAKDIYHGMFKSDAEDRSILKTARNMVILVNFITIPLAILLQGTILKIAYVSYAIRAIGAIVILLGIYLPFLINRTGVKLSFIGGTLVIFICVIAKALGWFSIDKTVGAVASGIVFIIVGLLIEKFLRKKDEKGTDSK